MTTGGKPMRIQPIEKDQTSDVVRRIYDSLEQRSGRVSPFFKMLAHKPDVLRAFLQLEGAVWADGALSPKLKDLAYLRVSIRNGCEY
jgi:alkylhydroperoxidase family enzyme